MNIKSKIEVLTFWIQNSDKIGEIPQKLMSIISSEEIDDLIVQIGELNKKDLIEFRDELKKEIQEEREKRKDKLDWFKTWVYPLLIPIITTIIIFLIMNNIVNPPKILDISVGEYYDVPASTEIPFQFMIKNPNPNKLVIYGDPIYRFTWGDYNSQNSNFHPVTTPKIDPSSIENINFQNQNTVLNAAGFADDSKFIEVKFKTPPLSDTIHVLTIILNTEKGKVSKEVRLKSVNITK